MLGARSVAVVGASARPGSFGDRLVTELRRSPAAPAVHLVNPRYAEVQGLPCLPSLRRHRRSPSTSCCSASATTRCEEQLTLAAERGDRSAVVFGSAWSPPAPGPSLRDRLTSIATGAGMALCGGGCMGFVDLASGLRAIGYLERDVLPPRPGRTGLALRVGVLGAAPQPPADRLDLGGLVRAGARDDDGRLPRARAGRPGDPGGRAGPGDGARAGAAAGRPRPRRARRTSPSSCSPSAAAARRRSW